MTEQMFEIKISATGEVRDADGNLVSSEPVEATMTVTESEAKTLGYIKGESA
jgi:hypothetical protein